MNFGNIYNLDEYLEGSGNLFDLFIGSVSFEDRCLDAAVKIKESSKIIKYIYFLDYFYLPNIPANENEDDIKKNRETRILQQNKNKTTLLSLFPDPAKFPQILIDNPLLDITKAIEKFFRDKADKIDESERICIDISTFTKPIIFLIMKTLIQKFRKKYFFVINTIPSSYPSSPLSFKIWRSEIMPTFNGTWKSQFKNVLIAIIGFEREKLSNIIDTWNFSKVIPIIGFPAYSPHLQLRSLEENASIIKSVKARGNIKYASSFDPFDSYKTMEEIIKNHNNCNIAIAPMGPKPMAFASSLLALKNDLRVLYSFPQEYNPDYSKKAGDSYLYEISLK